MNLLRIVIAITLFGHGIGHVMGFLGTWTNVQLNMLSTFNESPWIFSGGVVIRSAIGKVFGIFWLIAMVANFAAAIGLIINQSWWSTIALIASSISLFAIIPWWNTFTQGIMSKQSAVIVDIVIIATLLGPWKDELFARLGSG
jgi:hypothetical protein